MRTAWLLLIVAGCYAPAAPQGAPCSPGNECPAGQECRAGVCTSDPPPADAGRNSEAADSAVSPDGSPLDGAPLDAAMPDASMVTDPWGDVAGLVVRYPMDDSPVLTGTVASSDPAASGSCAGGECPASTPGIHGGGYRFAGEELAMIMESSLITSQPFTVSLWAWVDAQAAPYSHALSKPVDSLSNQNVFGFGLNEGRIAWESSDGTYDILYAPVQFDPTDRWHHYALRWDGSNKRIFIDGVLVTSRTAKMLDSALPISLGVDTDFGEPHTYYEGRLDELRIYHRALMPQEIERLATSSGP